MNDVKVNPYLSKTTPGMVSLDYVVAQVMNEKNDYDKYQRKRLKQIAINGTRQFQLYHIARATRQWIPVEPDLNIVPLPDDLMEFKAVGVPIEGKFWEFTEDREAIPPLSGDTLNQRREESRAEDIAGPVQNFAYPGGQNDFRYQLDLPNNRIVLITVFPVDEVMVVYKTTGINSKGDTLIPIHALDALVKYVEYHDVRRDPHQVTPNNMKQLLKQEMEDAIFDMRRMEHRWTMNQFLDIIRSGYGQTVKR